MSVGPRYRPRPQPPGLEVKVPFLWAIEQNNEIESKVLALSVSSVCHSDGSVLQGLLPLTMRKAASYVSRFGSSEQAALPQYVGDLTFYRIWTYIQEPLGSRL